MRRSGWHFGTLLLASWAVVATTLAPLLSFGTGAVSAETAVATAIPTPVPTALPSATAIPSGTPLPVAIPTTTATASVVPAIVGPSTPTAVPSGVAQGPVSLFSDAAFAPNQAPAPSQEPTVKRERYVNVNSSAFNDPRLRTKPGGSKDWILHINLYHDVVLTAALDRLEATHSGKGTVWSGRVQGDSTSTVILVYEGGILAGTIRTAGAVYRVRYTRTGAHVVQTIDERFYPRDLHRQPPTTTPNLPGRPAAVPNADDGSTLDLMVLYTPLSRANEGGTNAIERLIDLAVNETNQALQNSGIHSRMRLVYTGEVNYAESGNQNTDLDRLTFVDGFIDSIHELRNSHSADLVSFVVDYGGCGLAWVMNPISANFDDFAFNVVTRDCTVWALGHELGHNMAANHDRFEAGPGTISSSPLSYNYGYVDPGGEFYTIMAYGSSCRGGPCQRILQFSNPERSYRGRPTGIPEGSPNAADNRKTLNTTAPTVANFRQSTVTGIANDHFAFAETVSGLPYSAPSLNSSTLTLENGEPQPCGSMSKTAWYRFTPGFTGQITADTFGSDFDTVLAAYAGSSLSGLTNIACNDDTANHQSQVTVDVTAGNTYYFQIGGYQGAFGQQIFRITPVGCLLTLRANPSNGGTVSGVGAYVCGANVTALASATPSYAFRNWTENGSVISTNPSYSFILNTNRTLVANFDHVSTIANDAFAGAATVTVLPYNPPPVNTSGATIETGEPQPSSCDVAFDSASAGKVSNPPIGATVWYQYSPTYNGRFTADTFGSDFDTVLAVYRGASITSLTLIACNDDSRSPSGLQSSITFDATPNVLHVFQIGGYRGDTGNLTFHLRALAPANDNFAAAEIINVLPYASPPISNGGMGTEPGEPQPVDCQAITGTSETKRAGKAGSNTPPVGATAWYRFAAGFNSQVVADTFGSAFDTVLAVYRGTELGGLTLVACNDDSNVAATVNSSLAFVASAGTTYFFQIGGYAGQTGTLAFSVRTPVPPNDRFSGAAVIAALPYSAPLLFTGGAGFESGEPQPNNCQSLTGAAGGKAGLNLPNIGATVWYRFAPSGNGQIVANTFGSDFDTVIAVYRGTSLDGLTLLVCNDDSNVVPGVRSSLAFTGVAGDIYLFQVGGFYGGTGNLAFTVEAGSLPAPLLLQPLDGTALANLGPTALAWTLPTGATQYQLQVVPSSNAGPSINLIALAASGYTVQPPVLGSGNYIILPGIAYFWRVRATAYPSPVNEHDQSWGSWSDYWSFVTPPPTADTVTLHATGPGDNAASVSPTLVWSDSNTSIFMYDVQLGDDPTFIHTTTTLVNGALSNPLNSWTIAHPLPAHAVQYWRVRPHVPLGGTAVAWTAPRAFVPLGPPPRGDGWSVPRLATRTPGYSSRPRILGDGMGNAAMVWHEDGTIQFASQQAGGAWPSGTLLSVPGTNSQAPALARALDGTLVVAWEAALHGNWEIFVAIKPPGGDWSPPGNLSGNAGTSGWPQLAADATGIVHLVWEDDSSGNAEVYLRSRSPDGNWQTAVNLSNSLGQSFTPAIAAAPDDALHVVWTDNTPGNFDIYATSRRAGTNWSAPVNLSNSAGLSGSPALAVGPNARAYAVWNDDTLGNFEVFGASRSHTGVWTVPFNISHDNNSSTWPTIAVDRTGKVTTIWHSSGPVRILAAVQPQGGNWSQPAHIIRTSTATILSELSLSADSSGRLHLGWEEGVQGNHEIIAMVKEPGAFPLLFAAQPVRGAAGMELGVQPRVVLRNAQGNILSSDNATVVTLALRAATGGPGALLGCDQTSSGVTSMSAVAGIAAFTGCAIDRAGADYVLEATAPAVALGATDPFSITFAGDGNGDCRVSVTDYSIVVTHFGATRSSTRWSDITGPGFRADLNGDGRVSVVDFSLVVSRFGDSAPLCAAPSDGNPDPLPQMTAP